MEANEDKTEDAGVEVPIGKNYDEAVAEKNKSEDPAPGILEDPEGIEEFEEDEDEDEDEDTDEDDDDEE